MNDKSVTCTKHRVEQQVCNKSILQEAHDLMHKPTERSHTRAEHGCSCYRLLRSSGDAGLLSRVPPAWAVSWCLLHVATHAVTHTQTLGNRVTRVLRYILSGPAMGVAPSAVCSCLVWCLAPLSSACSAFCEFLVYAVTHARSVWASSGGCA
jgi:hypothetical protein